MSATAWQATANRLATASRGNEAESQQRGLVAVDKSKEKQAAEHMATDSLKLE